MRPTTAPEPSALHRFIAADRTAWRSLIAACAAVTAAGLDPQLLDPGRPSIRSALRQSPELEGFFLVQAVVPVGFLLLGGFLADTTRSVRWLVLALGGLGAASLLALATEPGSGARLLTRIGAWACTGFILTFAIGSVAVVYRGAARATAVGIAYAVFGLATAAGSGLLLLVDAGVAWPAFILCTLAAAGAMVLVRRDMPDLPGAGSVGSFAIAGLALFAFGVVSLVSGLLEIGRMDDPVRLILVAVGLGCIGGALAMRLMTLRAGRPTHFDPRPIALMLSIGIAVGFALAVPLVQLPVYFQAVRGTPEIASLAALAPFVIGAVLAAPLSGWMLSQIGVRNLVVWSAVAIGLADLAFAATLGATAAYAWFVVPLAALGAGVVIATSVRTAVLFASVPSGTPASAVGLNEASVTLGGRVGVVVATVVLTEIALGTVAASAPRGSGQLPGANVAAFREFLSHVGLADFGSRLGSVDASTLAVYRDAAVQGLRVTHLVAGAAAFAAALLARMTLSAGGPVGDEWMMSDEGPPRPQEQARQSLVRSTGDADAESG